MKNVIKDENLTEVARSIRPDSRKRIPIGKAIQGREDITYRMYTNKYGQIILDPQITIPAPEAWVFENKDILASIDRGMAESLDGKTVNRGSFAKYVEDES
ncbi:MAG: hypothetical protein JW712_03900 [Dehalococcoidales bacterium]|nr:hypothetical protein [Dehalococcoidales bacterium]